MLDLYIELYIYRLVHELQLFKVHEQYRGGFKLKSTSIEISGRYLKTRIAVHYPQQMIIDYFEGHTKRLTIRIINK